MSKSSKKDKFLTIADKIQRAALEATGKNVVPTELTFQQALSIHFRSRQLARETSSDNNEREKAKQIDICWRKRDAGRA